MNDLSHRVHWNKHDSGDNGDFSMDDSRRRPLPGPWAETFQLNWILDVLFMFFKKTTYFIRHTYVVLHFAEMSTLSISILYAVKRFRLELVS